MVAPRLLLTDTGDRVLEHANVFQLFIRPHTFRATEGPNNFLSCISSI